MTAEIEELVMAVGILGPIAFVLVYVLLTVLLVPGSVVTVAAGALFGPVWGSILVVIGASLGATAAFMIARGAGRERVRRRLGERLTRFDARLTGSGFVSVLVVRLVPVAPFNLTNYAFGLTGVRPRDYVVATVFGIVPATVAFVVLGSSLSDPTSPGFFISLAVVAALLIVVPTVDHRIRRGRVPAEETARVEEP